MTQPELLDTVLAILGTGILGLIAFMVKFLKDIAKNLTELNIKIAVVISNHDNLERRVEELEDKI